MTEPLSFMRDVGLLRQGPSKRKFTRTDLDKAAPGATAENRTRQRSVAAGSHLLYIGPTHSGAPNEPQARRSRMATWRSGYAAVCKTVYAGSIPAVASTSFPYDIDIVGSPARRPTHAVSCQLADRKLPPSGPRRTNIAMHHRYAAMR